jgi:uncharacterized repeat protein (TIGR03803 family)
MKKLLFILSLVICSIANAQISHIFNFSSANGTNPYGGLTLSGNVLYGMTWEGGTQGDGVIFSYNTVSGVYKVLLNFADTNGANPRGSLTLSGNMLYGMTEEGGAHSRGLIFSIDTNGNNYKDMLDFNSTNGSTPWGSLTVSGSMIYGMTEGGGANDDGLIFSIRTDGTNYKDLFDFDGTDGQAPYGPLTLSGPLLFGMTYGCPGVICSQSYGNVFSIDTNGSRFKVLLNFNNGGSSATYGGYGHGALTINGKVLYGMTYGGGANQLGILFSIDTNGTGYRDLLDFTTAKGTNPFGDLKLSGSELYGMTNSGGAHNEGVLFTIDTSGTGYDDLFDFNSIDGASPYFGSVVLSGSSIYGVTSNGGANSDGVIFKYDSLTTGISQIAKLNNQISVYPDPAANNIMIDAGNLQSTTYNLRIYDVVGNLAVEKILVEKRTNIDISTLPSGVYIVEVWAGNRMDVTRFVKE